MTTKTNHAKGCGARTNHTCQCGHGEFIHKHAGEQKAEYAGLQRCMREGCGCAQFAPEKLR